MNRREWIAGAAALLACKAAGGALQDSNFASTGSKPAQITVHTSRVIANIAKDFMGLGYETSSVAVPKLLHSENRVLIQLVRNLGSNGLLRVGGNTSDYASYEADGKPVSAPKATVLNAQSIEDLGGFLQAIGWRLIWGLNLGDGKQDQVLAEAQMVAQSAGQALLAFQAGNEPDLFVPAHRKAPYGFEDWYKEFRAYVDLVRSRLPNAPFAGPDVSGAVNWVSQFAENEGKAAALLTHHYYAEGPPTSPESTIENLLGKTAKLNTLLGELAVISAKVGVPYRICEANSCYGGGKEGVSDVFASALWGLDMLFLLAHANASGINIETGVNHLGKISWYSPIAPDASGHLRPRPLYYGLLAFAQMGRGSLLGTERDVTGLNLTAYSVRPAAGKIAIALINKDLTYGADVVLRTGSTATSAQMIRMRAPSATSKTGVLLGGAEVAYDGAWSPKIVHPLQGRGGVFDVQLPAASAAIVSVSG